MKALVTGGTGFIGRRLVQRLVSDGAEVVALVRRGNHELPEGARVVVGDISDAPSLTNAGMGCDRLYHLAAIITFDPRRREELFRVNGAGAANILEAAKRWGVARTVVVSSACTVGISSSAGRLLDETAAAPAALGDGNPYLASKLEAEKAALAAAKDRAVVIVNPTTVFGPGDRTLNSGTLVRTIARSLCVPVPPGGSNVVDVDDVVDGILAAGEKGRSGSRYILGGENLSFLRIFRAISGVVGHRPMMIPLPRWMREPAGWAAWLAGRLTGSRFLTPQMIRDMFAFKYYSCERARTELGWTPRSTFESSVAHAWAFYRSEGLI